MTLEQALLVLAIGFVAGVVGGLAGVGGSLIMIPGLALTLGYQTEAHAEHHVYMAAAMAVNVVVAARAARRHARADAVRRDLARTLIPPMLISIVLGVILSNFLEGAWLRLAFAAFLAAYSLAMIATAAGRRNESSERPERVTRSALVATGSTAGLVAGVLGLGGGVVIVPMLQAVSRVALRQSVATSTYVMQFTAVVGAALKIASLPALGLPITDALLYGGLMAPTALLGAPLGARLTHALPLAWVRLAVGLVLLASAARLAGVL